MKSNLYKGKYFITFYDKDNDKYLYSFDNVVQILRFQKKEITSKNTQNLIRLLYYALHKFNHRTRMLDGRLMFVYIIEADEVKEESKKENNL